MGTTGAAVGVTGLTHGLLGTSHWPADSEQSSTWPFGERQSLFLELSHVPEEGENGRVQSDIHFHVSFYLEAVLILFIFSK